MIKNNSFKKVIILFIYVTFFVAGPFLFVRGAGSVEQYNPIDDYLSFYLIFISPFLFIIPYKMAKLESALERLFFIFFGFIIPFVIVYTYLYFDYQKNFHPLS